VDIWVHSSTNDKPEWENTEMASRAQEKIVETILGHLERGVVPWKRPYRRDETGPRSVNGNPYHGINVILTGIQGYGDPRWITFREAKRRGGSVTKGEKGTPIIYYNVIKKTDKASGEETSFRFSKYLTVFNVEQTEGVEYPALPTVERDPVASIDTCERIVAGMPSPPKITNGASIPHYRPAEDTVGMPAKASFVESEGWYSTLFHELAHATGHRSRLDREGVVNPARFGSHSYSKEELVAEFAAAFLCGEGGIETSTIENSAAYIAGWKRKLQTDPGILISAASQGEKAANYITNRQEVTSQNGRINR
jgi:antirestriction protein ArdC